MAAVTRQEPPREPHRCEACRRERFRGPAMDRVDIPGVGMTLLCVDVAECKRHWPYDAPGLRSVAA